MNIAGLSMNLEVSEADLTSLMQRYSGELDEEICSRDERLLIYLVARSKGSPIGAARMYAFRQMPAARTSTQWWAGNEHFSERMGTRYADEVRALLADRGIVMGPHDDYDPGSAKFKGDPDAVISADEDPRSRLRRAQRLLADRQAAIERKPEVALAETIIQEKFGEMVRENPELARATVREKADLRERIIDTYAYRPERAVRGSAGT